ncbi:MAG TPA: lipid II flippase MurJ [Nitrospiraceae bacterium]|nr:lipid II flippase MurJ [Nitrospiraceae bacterium]
MALSAITFGQLASSFGIQWYTVTQLGAGAETDGLYAALTLPQIVMVILVDPLGFVLTPLLSIKNERERRIVGAQIVWLIAGCSLLITLLAVIVAPLTVPLLAPGFSESTVQLTVDLARIQATAIVGAACTMALSSLYHAGQNFLWPAASMLICSLVGWVILIVGIRSGGVTLAAWVQVITFVGPLFFLASPVAWWPWGEHGCLRGFLSEVWRQSKPLMVSASYCRTGFMVDRLLTSLLAPGSIVILELASRVHFAIVRILNQGVTTPIVPVLASLSNHGNWPVFRARYWDRLIWIVLVSFGMVLGLATVAILGPYFYHAGGEHSMMGTLRWEDLNKLTVALVIGSGVLMFGSINHLAMSAFYAQGDTRTPMRIQVLAHSLGIILKACGFFLGGLYGIMAAMSVAYGIEAAVLSVALNRRLSLRLRVDQQAPLELSTAGAPPRSP